VAVKHRASSIFATYSAQFEEASAQLLSVGPTRQRLRAEHTACTSPPCFARRHVLCGMVPRWWQRSV